MAESAWVVDPLLRLAPGAMFRRYAIVDERDLRSAVEMLARGHNGGTVKGESLAECRMMRRLTRYAARCPRRESNSHEIALGGF